MKDILSDAKKAFNSGKLKKARLILETLLATSDAEIGNKEIRIRASLLLTDIDMAEGSYSKSLESCWNLLTQKPPDIFLSEIYRKIGTIFRRKGETRQAEEYFLKSRDVSLTDEQRIRSFISLSGLYRIQSRFNKAISHGKEAFDLALAVQGQDNKYEELIAESLINLGLVKYNQGEFEAALPFFYQARDIYEQQEDCEAISRIKIMVANVLSRQGKYNEALDLYKQAKEMQEKLNLKSGVAVCLTAVGEIYLRTGDIKQAVTNFNGALSIETELENKWGLAILWKNLAGVYWLQNDIKEARENLSKSLLAFEDLLIKTTDYVEGLRLMINIDLEEGSYDRAEDNLKKLKVLADERRSSNQILDAKHAYEVSGLLECRGDHESAIDWLLKTYNMAYQLDLPDLKISCLLKLSKITIKLYERQSSGMNYQNGVNRAILYLNDVEKILHENSPVSTTRKDQEQDLLDRVTFYLEVIDKLTQEYDLPSLRVDVMVTRAMLFRTMNEFKKAEKLFKQAGKLSDKSGFVKRTMEIQALSRESRLQDKATKKSRMLELRQAKSYLDDVLRQISILRIDKNR